MRVAVLYQVVLGLPPVNSPSLSILTHLWTRRLNSHRSLSLSGYVLKIAGLEAKVDAFLGRDSLPMASR